MCACVQVYGQIQETCVPVKYSYFSLSVAILAHRLSCAYLSVSELAISACRAHLTVPLISAVPFIMSYARPSELVAGSARNMVLRGRVVKLSKEVRASSDVVSFYLVTEDGVRGLVLVEGWRDHARKLPLVAGEGKVVELQKFVVRALNQKRPWQCSGLDCYVAFQAQSVAKAVEEDESTRKMPNHLPWVDIESLPKYSTAAHLISVVAVFNSSEPPNSTKANAPLLNLMLGDMSKPVTVAVWARQAPSLQLSIPQEMIGKVVLVDSVRVSRGSQNTTDLGTTAATAIALAPSEVAETVMNRTAAKEELTSMSRKGGHIDYASSQTQVVHLGALSSLLVANAVRDLGGVVYEVYHCLVEDVTPIGDVDELWYMGCSVCKKKSCDHTAEHVPVYLASASIMTLEHATEAKGIGEVVETLLEIPAQTCKDSTDTLLTKMDVLRATPFNLRFVITKNQKGEKNALELVFAQKTYDAKAALVPSCPWSLVDTGIAGAPPCGLDQLRKEETWVTWLDSAQTALQLLVAITDTGDEVGVIQRDGDLTRVKRAAACCLSGQALVLHKTGDYPVMGKFLRLSQGDIVFAVVRYLDSDPDSWSFTVKAFQKVQDPRSFYEYFEQYCKFATGVYQAGRLKFDIQQTPKRRRTALEEDQKLGKPSIERRHFQEKTSRMVQRSRACRLPVRDHSCVLCCLDWGHP